MYGIPIGNDTLDVTHLVDTTAFSAAWTSGGIISTAEDLMKWSKGLYEGEILERYNTGLNESSCTVFQW